MTEGGRIGVSGLLFLVGLALLPFDSLPYLRGLLREMGAMAPFYPFSAGMALFVWTYRRERRSLAGVLPSRETTFRLAAFFLLWVFISLAVNWENISVSVFKGRSGSVKAILQSALLVYCFAAAAYSSAAARLPGVTWKNIERAVLLSFAVPALFSILEVLYLYHAVSGALLQQMRAFVSEDLRVYERARTISGEPAFFAVYCAFLTPWLLRWLLYARGRSALFAGAVNAYFIFIVVLTLSRAAYIMVAIEAAVFLSLAWLREGDRRRVLAVCAGFAACVAVFNLLAPRVTVYRNSIVENPVSTILAGTLDIGDPVTGLSTRVRLGAQIATFGVALENPFFGAGFAQAGFHMHKYIPDWVGSWYWEVENWRDPAPGTPWAPSHGLYARIAAETGFPGLLLWLGIWCALGTAILRRTLSLKGSKASAGAVLFASVCGILLAGFNADTFRFFEYWVTLGFSWAYLRARKEII